MNSETIKASLAHLSRHDLPTGAAALVGIILLVLVFRTAKFASKVLLFLVALALVAAAIWWHCHE